MSLVLNQFIYIDKLFKLEFLNDRISFFNYGQIDNKNKPTPIKFINSKLKIKQKAVKIHCLFKLLPLIIGDKIPIGNEYWHLILILAEIVDIIYSNDISLSLIAQLDWLIQEHHQLFKDLFPNITMKPKHHNLVHYPNALRQLGSLTDYLTLRFEAKHSFIKTSAHTVHNCKNLTYSVTKKHQIFTCFNLISQTLLNKEMDILKCEETRLSDIIQKELYSELLKNNLGIDNDIMVNCFLKVYGQLLKPKMLILIKENKISQVKIGKINDIIAIKGTVYFFCRIMPIKSFDSHYHSFEIVESEDFVLIEHDQFYHFHPFTEIKNLNKRDKRILVRLNFYITDY